MIPLSIYGSTGFVGSNFNKRFPGHICIPRDQRKPSSKTILYFISSVDNYHVYDDITRDVETNLSVLCQVLDYCRDSNITFNFISSWFVYGQGIELPAIESSPCSPTGFYSITKKCAEDLLISFCKTYDVNYRILRLCNVLGKGDLGASKKKNAITWMINRIKENKQVDLYDQGTPVRDIMHISDVCDAISLVCKKGEYNEIYNIGSGIPTSIGSIVTQARSLLSSTSKINYVEATEFHKIVQNKDFWMNIDKLRDLGFTPKYSINSIISELCS